jgi:hypothetical protein
MKRRLSVCGAVVVASLAVAAGAFAQAPQPPAALPGPLPLLPADNWWNADISGAPVDPLSTNFINFIGANDVVHPDFGGNADPFPSIYGMTYVVVPGSTPLEPVNFSAFGYPNESDVGAPGRPPGYPIPVGARSQVRWLEGGQAATCSINAPGCDGDRHLLLVDQDNRLLFELYQLFWSGTQWQAGSGAVFPLDSNLRRPEGWTSADAAGLAILPGLVRYDEVFGPNPIRHAFRMTVRATNGYVFPASHEAGDTAGALPMGARLRLKASTPLPANAQLAKIYQAMKTYGLIVADNGSDMYVTGAYDTRWASPLIGNRWGTITASDFEVVKLGWKPSTSPPVLNLSFHTLSPCRLFDTRDPGGPYGGPAVPPSGERIFKATGRCGIPDTAKAVSINAAVVVAGASGNLSFYPGDLAPPSASNLNFAPGQTRANNAVVKLSGSGTFGVFQFTVPAASVNVIVDVNGYFQ